MVTQLPPGSKTPGFLQQLQWIFNPTEYLETNGEKFPELFTAKPTGENLPVVFVHNPQALQFILTNDRKLFPALGDINRFLGPVLGDYSLIMIDGESHRKRRQLLMPSFHGDRIQTYGKLIENLTKKILNQLPKNQVFIAREVMQEISLQVILEVIFGVYEGELCQQIKEFVLLMSKLFSSPFSSAFMLLKILQQDWGRWTPWGNYIYHKNKLEQLLNVEIENRRKNVNKNNTDILSL
jgi:unspecific monooxygenase